MLLQRTQVNVALLGFGKRRRHFASYIKASEALPIRINITAVADSSGGLLVNQDSTIERAIAHKEAAAPLSEFAQRASILDIDEFVAHSHRRASQ